MAWHHKVHHHARSALFSLASKHPIVGLGLAALGVAAVVHVAAGKHATPAPATQNPNPTTT